MHKISFDELNIEQVRKYAADRRHKPLELYRTFLPYSSKFCLKLGYFSTNAIFPIATSIASFIAGGGKMEVVINHILRKEDKDLLVDDSIENELLIKSAIRDERELAELIKIGSEHFFSCLKYLKINGQLKIQPVKTKDGEMSHYKEGIFIDSEGNKVSFNGSCNFTYKGLVENGESISALYSWGNGSSEDIVDEDYEIFQNIINKKHYGYQYLDVSEIEAIVDNARDKDEEELIQDESDIIERFKNQSNTKYYNNYVSEDTSIFEYKPSSKNDVPRFPFHKPREYQIEAYNAWVANNCSGIFAMATGTGKTVTALNCLLNEYKKTRIYRAVITVPTIALVEQWKNECLKFNFKNIITVSSKSNWDDNLAFFNTASKLIDTSYIVIVTYASLPRQKFQSYFTQLPNDTLFIADETHNLGSKSISKLLQDIHLKKRIGLSATPSRKFDETGNKSIQEFFNDEPPYIVSFSMKEALERGVLCKYKYYPHIVELTDQEMKKYKELSLQLLRMGLFDKETGSFRSTPEIERKLIERKRIIHKATNKLHAFKGILKNEFKKKNNLKYTLIYVPEGVEVSFENRDYSVQTQEENRLINKYTKAVSKTDDTIMVKQFTANSNNRDEMLNSFEDGTVHVLTSMKCLDEGVDVPRSELAIFCASTGNPRQFIQRRGRVLRLHDDKTHATIHDLVVVPEIADKNTFEMEKGLVKKELERVVDFANLAMNKMETYETFKDILDYYNLNLNDL